VLISRHVTFDESSFPFAESTTPSSPSLDDYAFLHEHDVTVLPIGHSHFSSVAGHPPDVPVTSRAPRAALDAPASTTDAACMPHAATDASMLDGAARMPHAATDAATPSASLRVAAARDATATTTTSAGPRVALADVPGSSSTPGAASSCGARSRPLGPPSGFPPRAPGSSVAITPMVAPAPPVVNLASSVVVGQRARPSGLSPPGRIPAKVVPVPPVANDHAMRTRGKTGFRQPRLILQTSAISSIPSSVWAALADSNWHAAMMEEYAALQSNDTWSLVPRPAGVNIVTGKWIFTHKFRSDGTLERYKARWVLRGFTQRPGIDYDETFSPVVKPTTVRTVLTLAISHKWPIRQLDVKNAFLHGTLTETVYCVQPTGFADPSFPAHVCRLNKSLYGLKQAPRAWHSRFARFLLSIGFTESKTDASLFFYRSGSETAYLLLYVDDIVLTALSNSLLRRIIASLQHEFAMKDLGQLHHFLGVSVTHSSTGLFLSQRQYILDILERAGMQDCKPCSTPVDTCAKLSYDSPPVDDPSQYRSLVGALPWLTFTRPDIAFAVQQVCLFMHDPRVPHLLAVKRIIRYLRGTLDHGLRLCPTSATSLVVYTDSDWAGCPATHRSTSGYVVSPGDNLISWSSKRQHTVSRSSAEAEYRAVANGVAKACWLRQLLQELHAPLSVRLLSIVIMSVRFISPQTRFSISVRNMLKLICTSSVSASPSVMCVFCTFPPLSSLLIFSRRVFCPQYSWISAVI